MIANVGLHDSNLALKKRKERLKSAPSGFRAAVIVGYRAFTDWWSAAGDDAILCQCC